MQRTAVGGRREVRAIKKTKQMTDLECVEELLNRQEAERVIYWEYCTNAVAAIQYGKTITEAYTDPRFSYDTQKQIARDIGWLFQPIYPSLGSDFGGEVKWPESVYAQAPVIIKYPIEQEEDIYRLKIPDLESLPSVQSGLEFCRISAGEKLDNEPFNVTFSCAGPFTTAGDLCGLDKLARWLIKKPEAVHHLLRVTTDYIIRAANIWMKNFPQANIIFLQSEPLTSNQIISPEHFVQFALPYIKEVHQKVLNMGYRNIFCHVCGDQNANLPYWAEVPMGNPGIVSVGHQVDVETAAGFFPHDIIHGNLNPVIIQTETPRKIYENAKQVIQKGKRISNRYIFGQGCELPPRAKKENMQAMVRAVEDFGWN
jgi:uroporphyrinogen decarboxylase